MQMESNVSKFFKFPVKKSACLGGAGDRMVALACAANYWTIDDDECTCEATRTDSVFTCNPNYSPTCSPSKNKVRE